VGAILEKKPSYKSITLDDRTISVVGNIAIARYSAAVDLDAGGKALSLKLGVMTV
jgi:hypothetical protein